MIHFDTLNISYGQKKGQGSKCQFDSRPLKVGNHLNLLACKWCVAYHFKALNEGYNFASNINWRFAQKVMGFQNRESPHFENFKTLPS
jgi:hypothetical protein